MPRSFDFKGLRVYELSLEFIAVVRPIVVHGRWPDRSLLDQLQRAATSISLNIAEGAGEFSSAEKIRFYRMARRSAAECAAVLDVLVRTRVVPHQMTERPTHQLEEISAMLTAMILRRTAGQTGQSQSVGQP